MFFWHESCDPLNALDIFYSETLSTYAINLHDQILVACTDLDGSPLLHSHAFLFIFLGFVAFAY